MGWQRCTVCACAYVCEHARVQEDPTWGRFSDSVVEKWGHLGSGCSRQVRRAGQLVTKAEKRAPVRKALGPPGSRPLATAWHTHPAGEPSAATPSLPAF